MTEEDLRKLEDLISKISTNPALSKHSDIIFDLMDAVADLRTGSATPQQVRKLAAKLKESAGDDCPDELTSYAASISGEPAPSPTYAPAPEAEDNPVLSDLRQEFARIAGKTAPKTPAPAAKKAETAVKKKQATERDFVTCLENIISFLGPFSESEFSSLKKEAEQLLVAGKSFSQSFYGNTDGAHLLLDPYYLSRAPDLQNKVANFEWRISQVGSEPGMQDILDGLWQATMDVETARSELVSIIYPTFQEERQNFENFPDELDTLSEDSSSEKVKTAKTHSEGWLDWYEGRKANLPDSVNSALSTTVTRIKQGKSKVSALEFYTGNYRPYGNGLANLETLVEDAEQRIGRSDSESFGVASQQTVNMVSSVRKSEKRRQELILALGKLEDDGHYVPLMSQSLSSPRGEFKQRLDSIKNQSKKVTLKHDLLALRLGKAFIKANGSVTVGDEDYPSFDEYSERFDSMVDSMSGFFGQDTDLSTVSLDELAGYYEKIKGFSKEIFKLTLFKKRLDELRDTHRPLFNTQSEARELADRWDGIYRKASMWSDEIDTFNESLGYEISSRYKKTLGEIRGAPATIDFSSSDVGAYKRQLQETEQFLSETIARATAFLDYRMVSEDSAAEMVSAIKAKRTEMEVTKKRLSKLKKEISQRRKSDSSRFRQLKRTVKQLRGMTEGPELSDYSELAQLYDEALVLSSEISFDLIKKEEEGAEIESYLGAVLKNKQIRSHIMPELTELEVPEALPELLAAQQSLSALDEELRLRRGINRKSMQSAIEKLRSASQRAQEVAGELPEPDTYARVLKAELGYLEHEFRVMEKKTQECTDIVRRGYRKPSFVGMVSCPSQVDVDMLERTVLTEFQAVRNKLTPRADPEHITSVKEKLKGIFSDDREGLERYLEDYVEGASAVLLRLDEAEKKLKSAKAEFDSSIEEYREAYLASEPEITSAIINGDCSSVIGGSGLVSVLRSKLQGIDLKNVSGEEYSFALSSRRLDSESEMLASLETVAEFRNALHSGEEYADGELAGIPVSEVSKASFKLGEIGSSIRDAIGALQRGRPSDYIDASIRSYGVVNRDMEEFTSQYLRAKSSGAIHDSEVTVAAHEEERRWVEDVRSQLIESAEALGILDYGRVVGAAFTGGAVPEDDTERQLYQKAVELWVETKTEREFAIRRAALRAKYSGKQELLSDAETILDYAQSVQSG